MHYIMNKDKPVICIEAAKIIKENAIEQHYKSKGDTTMEHKCPICGDTLIRDDNLKFGVFSFVDDLDKDSEVILSKELESTSMNKMKQYLCTRVHIELCNRCGYVATFANKHWNTK